MALIRLLTRTFFFTVVLSAYYVLAFFIFAYNGFNSHKARPMLARIVSWTSQMGLKIFNVEVRKNFSPVDIDDNYLIISNHLSYLDILIISSIFPTCFVTSREMKETPFLGKICELAGCLFVERRKRSGIADEIKELKNALLEGLNVVVFPEAKSTNGEKVLSFRRPLFQAAFDSKTKVLPLCINYKKLDNEKVSLKNRDKVFWYGDMSFFKHALTLLKHKRVIAEITVMKTVDVSEFADKADIAEHCFRLVSDEFQVITQAE